MYDKKSAIFVVMSDLSNSKKLSCIAKIQPLSLSCQTYQNLKKRLLSSEPHMLTKIQPFLFHVNFNNINKMLPCLTEFYLFSFSCQPLPQHSQFNEKFSYFRFMSISQENVTIPDGISSILASHARLLLQNSHINENTAKFGSYQSHTKKVRHSQRLFIQFGFHAVSTHMTVMFRYSVLDARKLNQ